MHQMWKPSSPQTGNEPLLYFLGANHKEEEGWVWSAGDIKSLIIIWGRESTLKYTVYLRVFFSFFFLLMTTYGIVCVTGVVRNGPRWMTQSHQMAESFTDDRQKLKVLRRTSRMNRRIWAGERTEQTQQTKLRSKQADVEKQDRFWGPTGKWRQVRYETQVKVIWGVKEANSKQDTGGNYQNKTGNNNHKWNKRTLKCEGCSSGRENEWTT